jgi:integrase
MHVHGSQADTACPAGRSHLAELRVRRVRPRGGHTERGEDGAAFSRQRRAGSVPPPAGEPPLERWRVFLHPKQRTPEDINLIFEVLDLRERLVVKFAILEGMRPGEILALRWRNLGEESFTVEARVYRGDLDTPKTKKSVRVGALSLATIQDLKSWMELRHDPSPDGFVFPSEKLSTPLGRGNLWRRNIQPRLEKIGLEWASFQVMRRSNASLGRKARIDDKVAADQRGHGPGVSMDVYASSDLSQKVEAIRQLETFVVQ